jgi:hypothetical protein
VVRALGQVFSGVSSADWFRWLLWLVLDFLRYHWLEFEESYPLRYTYCMNAQ